METLKTDLNSKVQISMPRLLLSSEGLALFLGSIALYIFIGGNGWLFLLLLLAPDIALFDYFGNLGIRAIFYNIVHTTSLPIILGIIAVFFAWHLGMSLALIWLAHIGMDRMLGFGLKYPDDFKVTHLQKV